MKKILHISKYYNPHIGGIESTCENIVDILKETNNYQQMVICFGNENIGLVNGVPIVRVKSCIKIRSQSIAISYFPILKKTIKTFKPDIILFHAPNPFVSRALLKCHFKGKIIIMHHADIIKQKILKKFVMPYIRKLYKKSNLIIATSNNYLENSYELSEYKSKCVVIPSCYRNENVFIHNSELKLVDTIRNKYKTPIAIFTGRHVGYKGLEYAINSFRYVNGVTFLIGGSGPLDKKLQKLAMPYENIHFIGMLNSKLYRVYLNASDFFLFPSCQKNEAFGVSLVEAMAAGKPAITFTIEGSAVNWINLNGVTGIECKNRNVKELAEAINLLKSNEKLRLKYGANAKNRAMQLFSYEKFAQNICNLFEKI